MFQSPTIRVFVCLVSAAVGLAGCGKDTLVALETTTEEFTQNSAAEIDVLWVIDNSESMAQEQQGLGESFQSFIATLASSNVDYHIGVISTDPADEGFLHTGPSNVPYLTRDTPIADEVFLENVTVGINGARAEQGMATTAMALGKPGAWAPGDPVTPPNPTFLRDEAALFIIMVSDEEDNSYGPVDYYRRLFESYKGPGNEARISVSAIVGPASDDEQGCYDAMRGSAQPGARYIDLAGQTGGVFASICSDFNSSLENLSITAAGLKAIFQLTGRPNTNARLDCPGVASSAFCVRVNGTPVAPGNAVDGYTFDKDKNAIVFGVHDVPPPEAKVTVAFQEL